MTFKEFTNWANARACDGQWGTVLVRDCLHVGRAIWEAPFWRRKKLWAAVCDDEGLNLLNRITEVEVIWQNRQSMH